MSFERVSHGFGAHDHTNPKRKRGQQDEEPSRVPALPRVASGWCGQPCYRDEIRSCVLFCRLLCRSLLLA